MWLLPALLPLVFVAGCAFAALGLCFTAILPTIDHMNLPVFLLVIPMGMMSATYFPLEHPVLVALSLVNPLYHLAQVFRGRSHRRACGRPTCGAARGTVSRDAGRSGTDSTFASCAAASSGIDHVGGLERAPQAPLMFGGAPGDPWRPSGTRPLPGPREGRPWAPARGTGGYSLHHRRVISVKTSTACSMRSTSQYSSVWWASGQLARDQG